MSKPPYLSAPMLVMALFLTRSLCAVADTREPFQGPPTVISLGSFGRSVANLDRAIAFYRDVMGMELVENKIPDPRIDAAFEKLTNTPNTKSRTVHFKVPYAPINLALTEFSNVPQTPVQGNPGQPGIPWLTLSLKDDASFSEIEKTHPPTFSLFGDRPPPSSPPGSGGNKGGPPNSFMKPDVIGAVLKVAFIRDADGFLVEVLHRGPKSWFTVPDPILLSEQATDPIKGPPVVGLQIVLWERSEDAMRFYYSLLGFDIRPGYTRSLQELNSISSRLPDDSECSKDQGRPTMMDMASQKPASGCWSAMPGPPSAAPAGKGSRGVSGNCAGIRCEWFENDPPGKPFQPRIQDPGAGYLSMWVSDLDELLVNLKNAGVEVVTAGGKPVLFSDSRRVLVRDFSGYYIIIMQRQ